MPRLNRGGVAQLVEHEAFNLQVVGSSPTALIMSTLRRTGASALAALRVYRGSAALIGLTGAGVLAALLSVISLRAPDSATGTSLRIAAAELPAAGIAWTNVAQSASDTQQAAVAELFTLLLATSAAGLAVAILTILSLSAARASTRRGEVTIRRAVGASRRDLFLAALAEGTAIAVPVLAGGIALGAVGARIAAGSWPGLVGEWRFSPVLAATLVSGVILLGALFPLIHARLRRLDDATTGSIPHVIPAIQLGLSLTLLVTGAAILRFAAEQSQPATHAQRQGTVFHIDTSEIGPSERAERYGDLVGRLGRIDGLSPVSLTSRAAVLGLGAVDFLKTDCGICMRGGILLPWLELYATHLFVSTDTFRGPGYSMVEGRGFTAADREGSAPVAVVNQYLAARYFQDGDAVGRDVFVGAGLKPSRYRVVGVVEDTRSAAFGGGTLPLESVYLSMLQHPAASADLVVRQSPGSDDDIAVREILRETLGIADSKIVAAPMSTIVARDAAPLGWFGRWFALEGAVTLLITLVGTFAAMALWVKSLEPELALRRAVGATRLRIAALVLRQAAAIGLRGIAIGLIFFAPMFWAPLGSVMPGIEPWDPALIARVAALLVLTAAAGAALPTWHAVRQAPVAMLGRS